MFDFIKRRLSVRLSLVLALLVVPCMGMVGTLVTVREVQIVQSSVLQEARTAAIAGALAYGAVLDAAVDSKTLTLEDILSPVYEEMPFTDENQKPIHPEDARYHTRLGDYTDHMGVQNIQDTISRSGHFMYSSGMDRRGYVATAHSWQNEPPRGDATEETRAWDRVHSRGKRMYDKNEQISAAGFLGNAKTPTLTQEYPRDTGEMAWDVVAPISCKGRHFGGFRIGVPRDRIDQQRQDLIIGLFVLFGMLTIVFTVFVFWQVRRHIGPLRELTMRIDSMSSSADYLDLSERISSNDPTEVGDLSRSVNRLRGCLYGAMERLDKLDGDQT